MPSRRVSGAGLMRQYSSKENSTMSDSPLADHYASQDLGESIDAETLISIIENRELPPEVLEKINAILAPYAERATETREDVIRSEDESDDEQNTSDDNLQ